MSRADQVLDELKRRAAKERSLGSGANRGDWLYAAAVQMFGSWGKAVEAAGFDYSAIKSRPLTKEEVITKLKELAADGESLAATEHGKLAAAAHRHFGSWGGAVAHAGETPAGIKWTSTAVIAAIHAHQAKGQPVNSVAMMTRDMNLYMAGRRRFGTWAAALGASTTGERAPGRSAVGRKPLSRKRVR